MKKIWISVLLLFAGVVLMTYTTAQSFQHPTEPVVHYAFDGAGNIVSRTVTWESLTLPGHDTLIDPFIDTIFRYYPNPVRLSLTAEAVNYTGDYPIYYELYGSNGALVRSLKSIQSLTEIDMGELSTGIYIMRGLRGDTVISEQIIKVE
ncbi:MAG: T9SS type A sorting domain-containing protein [Muribaculaceae bacterium]|nr:T9SS type A sorting domain-containing protein [Muribaculaceae bacterium]